MMCRCHVCRRQRWRALWIGVAVFFGIQGVVFAAYTPGFLLPANNLSDLASAATARTNLGLGTAATKAASASGDATLASVTGSYTVGHIATFSDTSGSLQDGGAAGPAITVPAHVTGSGATQTLATTNMSTTISDITVAAVWSLPAIQAAGYRQCLKDGTTNFLTNNQTVKPNPTSLTIDGVAGTTGILANQTHQELCFISDGTNWFVE